MISQTITLTNKGTTIIDASEITVTDPAKFSVSAATPSIIPPGGTAQITVTFLGSEDYGLHEATLIIRAGNLVLPLQAGVIMYELGQGGGQVHGPVEIRIVTDAVGRWCEVGFLSPVNDLIGSAANGWTDAGGNLLFRFHRSDNLTTWDHDFVEVPGGTPDGPDGNGDFMYWARLARPLIYFSSTLDQRIQTTRHGKSITQIRVFGVPVSGLSYPYAMPADAARLQADLRAAGHPSATVSTTTGSWSAIIRNFAFTSTAFKATWSGSDIVSLSTVYGTPVSLPHFPYTMPADEAQLEADLIAAGYTYAQATLHKDSWEVFLPDLVSTGAERRFEIDITPGDPVQIWDIFGNPTGIAQQNLLAGTAENIRVGGETLQEDPLRAFVRMGVSRGPNYKF